MATTSPQQLTSWAADLLTSVGNTGIPTSLVVSWLRNNLGTLNNAIASSYAISGVEQHISPGMSMEASGIYSEMYYCYYLSRESAKSIGALSFDWVSIKGDDQGDIKRVTGNDKAKTYSSMAKDCKERLGELIDWYNKNANPVVPFQTLYNTRSGSANTGIRSYGSYYPPSTLYSTHNVVWTPETL